jgi:hypothetical protein
MTREQGPMIRFLPDLQHYSFQTPFIQQTGADMKNRANLSQINPNSTTKSTLQFELHPDTGTGILSVV